MNVLHAVPSLGVSGGGPSRSVSQLCAALANEGSDVSILTGQEVNDPMVTLASNVDVHAVTMRAHSMRERLRAPGFSNKMEELTRAHGVDIVHQHGLWLRSSHEVVKTATRHSIPIVLSPRGMVEEWSMNHSKWKKKLAWCLYQQRDLEQVAVFHATGASEVEGLRRLGLKQPIAVIPNGVQLPKAIECEGNKVERLKGEKKTALFLSRISPKKGILMLLEAWKQLSPENWELIIAGNDDSDHLPAVNKAIEDLGLSNQVRVVGPLYSEEKRQAFLNADLFLLPSHSENFGIVVAEALGFGVPVLTTRTCPWGELESEQCGWWVEPTVEGIHSGLSDALVSSNETLRAMGARGRALVERKYQWPSLANQMLEVYQWILQGGAKPGCVV